MTEFRKVTIRPISKPASTEISHVLAIGAWDRGDFAIARQSIGPERKLRTAPDCQTACEMLLRDELAPEFILLAQTLPGIYCQDEIEQLRRAAPLAQIVAVAGTWCEGELRSGEPLAGVLRLYWYELAQWSHSLGQRSTESLSLDGPFSPRQAQASSTVLPITVAIHAPTYASFETLSESLSQQGIESFWCRDSAQLPRQVSIGIWDGSQLDPGEFVRLKEFTASVQEHGGSVLVLLDFPRKDHFAQLRPLGINTILGKPYVVNELVMALQKSRDPGTAIPGLGVLPIL